MRFSAQGPLGVLMQPYFLYLNLFDLSYEIGTNHDLIYRE